MCNVQNSTVLYICTVLCSVQFITCIVPVERNEQLKELRKKEAAMAEFVAEFESNRKRERERIEALQGSIPTLLESASRSLAVLQQHGRKGPPRALLSATRRKGALRSLTPKY